MKTKNNVLITRLFALCMALTTSLSIHPMEWTANLKNALINRLKTDRRVQAAVVLTAGYGLYRLLTRKPSDTSIKPSTDKTTAKSDKPAPVQNHPTQIDTQTNPTGRATEGASKSALASSEGNAATTQNDKSSFQCACNSKLCTNPLNPFCPVNLKKILTKKLGKTPTGRELADHYYTMTASISALSEAIQETGLAIAYIPSQFTGSVRPLIIDPTNGFVIDPAATRNQLQFIAALTDQEPEVKRAADSSAASASDASPAPVGTIDDYQEEADFASLSQIYEQCYEHLGDGAFNTERLKELLRVKTPLMNLPQYFGKMQVKVLRDHGEIAGAVTYYPAYPTTTTGMIHHLIIDQKHRKKGYGRQLTQYAMKQLKDLGCKLAALSVLENSLPAIRLYKQLGFTLEGILPSGRSAMMTREL